jgi:hypothetical protein
MRMPGVTILALVLSIAAAGCARTMKDVVAWKEDGTAVVYPVNPARAWEMSEAILWDATRVTPEDHKTYGFECVTGGLGDDETLIVVWVEPREKPKESLVTVVARRANGAQLAIVLTEEEFHSRFRRLAGLRDPKEMEK